jgi:hypothetical protein
MKRSLTLAAIIVVATIWILPSGLMAQEGGQCYFQATEDIYLKIYNLDKDGVERWKVWEGHLPEGGAKSFNAPYGQVGYATKKNPDDPWEENQEECYGGAAIEIP